MSDIPLSELIKMIDSEKVRDEHIRVTIPGWASYKIQNPGPGLPVYSYPSPPNVRMPRWLIFLLGLVTGLLIWLILAPYSCHAKQTQPDAKRVREIQAALIDHGYVPGKTWLETQEILRTIALDHHWQARRAPDARVLILLGLGNKYSDPEVTTEGHNHLDGGSDEE